MRRPPGLRARRLAWPTWALALGLALTGVARVAPAAEWGGIVPGASTTERVRERWGAPSKETPLRVEGYDTLQWVYEGTRAPDGLKRMIVDFGLLAATGYKPNVVRLVTLEPKPGIFGRNTVLDGWGEPDGFRGKEGENLSFFYSDGLLIFFNKEDFAFSMVFSVPQPVAPGQAPPAERPPGPRSPSTTPAPPPAGGPTLRR